MMRVIDEIKAGKRKLVFGDPEIVSAVRSFERDLEREAEEAKMDTYEVTLSVSGSFTVKVKAHDKEEAEEFAKDEFTSSDMEIDDVNVESCEVVDDKE
jgi:hypothetical protein